MSMLASTDDDDWPKVAAPVTVIKRSNVPMYFIIVKVRMYGNLMLTLQLGANNQLNFSEYKSASLINILSLTALDASFERSSPAFQETILFISLPIIG